MNKRLVNQNKRREKNERLGRLLTYQLTIKLVFFTRKFIFVSPHSRSLVYQCCSLVFSCLCFFSCYMFWEQAKYPHLSPSISVLIRHVRRILKLAENLVRVLLNIYKWTHEHFVFRAHWLSSLRNFLLVGILRCLCAGKPFSPKKVLVRTFSSFLSLERTTHFVGGSNGTAEWKAEQIIEMPHAQTNTRSTKFSLQWNRERRCVRGGS